MKGVSISFWDQITLLRIFNGMLMKFIFAYLYQEYYIDADFLHGWIGMDIGVFLMPYYNWFASLVSGIPQTDKMVTQSYNLYPGHSQCKYSSPHALWHEQSANGFVEAMFFANQMYKMMSGVNQK